MLQKFQQGDIAKIKETGENVLVISYKQDASGLALNLLNNNKEKVPIKNTETIECYGIIDNKFQHKDIHQNDLDLIWRKS